MTFSPQTILVPLSLDLEDDLQIADKSVTAACDIATKYGAKLILCHVASTFVAGANAGVDITGNIYHAMTLVVQARLSRGQKQLQEFKQKAKQVGVKDVQVELVETEQDIAHVICETAQQHHADLLVVGSRGKSGLKKLFLGSVAEKVAHLSHVPVLLIHPDR